MLVRGFRRLILIVLPLFFLFYTVIRHFRSRSPISYTVADWIQQILPISHIFGTRHGQQVLGDQGGSRNIYKGSDNNGLSEAPHTNELSSSENVDDSVDSSHINTHTELFSASTPDGKYFKINFGDKVAINPNIVPHPLLDNVWVIVANHYDLDDAIPTHFVELVCDAAFNEGGTELGCLFPPIPLPIVATGLGKCEGELQYASLNVGPHDARVLYGPRTPFIVYGSNSHETCFGQWIQDFQVLMNWNGDGNLEDASATPEEQEQESFFQLGTELHRPPPYSPIEKNWFLFWDPDGQMYAHYDIAPRRIFAKLDVGGSVGPDLAPLAAVNNDDKCMEKYVPKPGPEHESIHQATNSLSITMCQRSDPSCSPSDTNTFLFTIFQHKTFHDFHSVYEPYAMVFRRREPFQVYGVSQNPLWIHGRNTRNRMFYVTSMSWKARGQKYHGYLDDILFLNFGIEDRHTAGIDILASDILSSLGFC
ncbi:uncharacterized protein GGS22DRAFT_102809 [Annulohypoxylon maeteangense]|uniref:uncharacterized protein n=1 Tax=Annulohypoxylon maeteangense TaxID=1927788 RepID=UPI00200762A6|nr:uncharacterized protein GGS22DRAFT_102809 [Annulohypoxylon maeteangense]KAI0879890.1 hypothetical protein GGS22DRAFT_102809 [Annulohypoxylon maeteangense]